MSCIHFLLLAECILWFLSFCFRKKRSKPIQRYAGTNLFRQVDFPSYIYYMYSISDITGGQEVIYDDIRVSRMVDNGAGTSTMVCNLPSNLDEVITSVEKDKMTKEPSNQALIPLTRSKTLDPEEYGRWYRGSDNYNHIHFNSLKHCRRFQT